MRGYRRMKIVSFVTLSALALGVEASRPKLDCLKGLDTSFPRSKTYKNATFSWNSRLKNPKPAAVVRPLDEDQIKQAVRCAAAKTTISVRSGGHSYEGYWLGNKNGVVVDLRYMKKIKINKKSKSVTVQAGALIGNILAKLWKEDKGVLPHGLQGNVGVGGLTLGGGYGLLSRNYGLLADRVVSIKMVDAKGKLLTVNKGKNADLFEALLGAGGGSFGVVTEFVFKYIRHLQKFTVARYGWNASKKNFTKIVNRVMKYYDSNPPNGAGHYFNLSPGGSLELGITYSDNPSRHQKHIEDLERIIKPWNKKEVQKKNWIDAYLTFAGYAGKPDTKGSFETLRDTTPMTESSFYKAKSGFLRKRLVKKVIKRLNPILVKPGKNLFVLIDLWQGVIPNKEGTSFANRDKFASVQIGATDESAIPLLKKVYRALEGSFDGAYQNYIDAEEPNFMHTYYPGIEDKLIKTKAKYDKKDVFKFNFSIPTKKPVKTRSKSKEKRPNTNLANLPKTAYLAQYPTSNH